MRIRRRPIVVPTALLAMAALLGGCEVGDPPSEAIPAPPATSEAPLPTSTPLTKEDLLELRRKAEAEQRKELAAAQRARRRARRQLAETEVLLTQTLTRLFADYNGQDFDRASMSVADRLVRRCGGRRELARAFAQNRDAEGLEYTLDDVKVRNLSDRAARAAITYSTRDESTGQLVDERASIRLSFVKAPVRETGWALDDLFPVGVSGYCD